MITKMYHLKEQEIPDGFQIFESTVSVVGIQYRKIAALSFAKEKELRWLEFERDDHNAYDKNAIKIIGCCGETRYFIGYIPKETSRLIVEGDFLGQVVPRLLKTYVGGDDFVEIQFQLLGPVGKKYQYLQTKKTEGKHCSDYVNRVKQLMQERNHPEAIELLLRLIDQTELEAKKDNSAVAPWYYEQLAIIYRKDKRYKDEVMLLERFENQPKNLSTTVKTLSERLIKARKLAQ